MTLPLASVRLGEGSFIGFGSPAAYATNGTASDIDVRYYIDEAADNLQLERQRIEFNDLTSAFPIKQTRAAGIRKVTGSITLRMTWGGLQDLMRFLSGHNVAVSGAGPYDYAFVPPEWGSNWWISNSRGMTVEVFRGNPATNSVFYHGCEISEMAWKFESGSRVEVSISFIGRGYSIGAKSTTPAFESDFMITPTGQAQATNPFLQLDGGAGLTTFTTRSLNLALTPGIDFRNEVTAIETLLPYPTEKWAVKLDAEIECGNDNLLTVLDDPVGSSLQAVRIELHQGSGATERQLLFQLDELVLDSPVESRPAGIGVVLTNFSGMAESSAAGTASWTCTLKNGDSDYNIT